MRQVQVSCGRTSRLLVLQGRHLPRHACVHRGAARARGVLQTQELPLVLPKVLQKGEGGTIQAPRCACAGPDQEAQPALSLADPSHRVGRPSAARADSVARALERPAFVFSVCRECCVSVCLVAGCGGGLPGGFWLQIYGLTDLRIHPPPSPSRGPAVRRRSGNQVGAGTRRDARRLLARPRSRGVHTTIDREDTLGHTSYVL